MKNWNSVKSFWNYVIFYPEEDEDGYDGIHKGGIKGIQTDAPEEAKNAYKEYVERKNKERANGIKT